MKRIIYLVVIITITVFVMFLAIKQDTICNYNISENIIVCADTSIIPNNFSKINIDDIEPNNIKSIFNRFNIDTCYMIYKNRYDKSGKLKKDIVCNDKYTWFKFNTTNIQQSEQIIKELKKQKGILHSYVEKPLQIKPCTVPNDSAYSQQWHLNSSSFPNADIDIEQAWNINKGRNDVIIAVCDGGVDYTHPDLDPGDRSRVIAGYDSGSNDNDPMDDLPSSGESFGGHGTHVAGIIGAIPNNNNKVAGIMWNCKIMPVKMVGRVAKIFGGTVYDFSAIAFPSDVADAIDYAVNNGAKVINLSYGFNSLGQTLNEVILRVPLLHSAIANAYNNNVVIVAAIGNEYNEGNPIEYPAAFKEVIAVGATDETSPVSKWLGSNTGSHISISAPGSAIWSTFRDDSMGYKSGTSMATPIVSGVAGLIISQAMDRGFNLTNDDVKHIMEQTADDVIQYGEGFDEHTGHGKVNAYEALSLLKEPYTVVHGRAQGGNYSQKTFNKWIYISSKWGLAPGTYLKVKQYEVTKHVTFPNAFLDIPKLWMRERTSACMSFANPNTGYPYCEITNITETGFDIKYATYYIGYNISAQYINKWVPHHPNSSYIDYTAIGIIAPTISGPSIICPSGSSFTVDNLPSGFTIEWSQSSNINRDSAQGSNPCTFSAHNYGDGWIEAKIKASNGNIVKIINQTVSVNKPYPGDLSLSLYNSDGSETSYMCPNKHYHIYINNNGGGQLSNYTWSIPSGWTKNYAWSNMISVYTGSSPGGMVEVYADTYCGTNVRVLTDYLMEAYDCNSYYMSISPNPTTGETTISLTSNDTKQPLSNDIEWEIEIYDWSKSLRIKQPKIRGSQYKFNTANLLTGVYTVRVKIGDQVVTEKLIVK